MDTQGGRADSPLECDFDTVRAKSRIMTLVQVKWEEREGKNRVRDHEHRKIGVCVGGAFGKLDFKKKGDRHILRVPSCIG